MSHRATAVIVLAGATFWAAAPSGRTLCPSSSDLSGPGMVTADDFMAVYAKPGATLGA